MMLFRKDNCGFQDLITKTKVISLSIMKKDLLYIKGSFDFISIWGMFTVRKS